jgi:DNA-binding NtrC family response regulator
MTKLLLVDDSESNRITLSVLLEEEGFTVAVARSFQEARERIGSDSFDAVLLDQNLGDGKGTDLVPLVRQRMPAAKVLLISGSVREDQVNTRELDGIVAKGAAFPDVLELVRRALG